MNGNSTSIFPFHCSSLETKIPWIICMSFPHAQETFSRVVLGLTKLSNFFWWFPPLSRSEQRRLFLLLWNSIMPWKINISSIKVHSHIGPVSTSTCFSFEKRVGGNQDIDLFDDFLYSNNYAMAGPINPVIQE